MAKEERLYSTGIVRRLDEIGRVVIPAEIRETLGWEKGDAIELYCDRHGRIILKKYSQLAGIDGLAVLFINILHEFIKKPIILCDKDAIVAVSGTSSTSLGKVPPKYIINSIVEIKIVRDDKHVVYPILSSRGNIYGALAVIINKDEFTNELETLLRLSVKFLSDYLEN